MTLTALPALWSSIILSQIQVPISLHLMYL